eukprot:2563485-Prymnesium_polylepis.1
MFQACMPELGLPGHGSAEVPRQVARWQAHPAPWSVNAQYTTCAVADTFVHLARLRRVYQSSLPLRGRPSPHCAGRAVR